MNVAKYLKWVIGAVALVAVAAYFLFTPSKKTANVESEKSQTRIPDPWSLSTSREERADYWAQRGVYLNPDTPEPVIGRVKSAVNDYTVAPYP